MNVGALFAVAALAIAGLCVLLAFGIVLRRAVRQRLERRRHDLAEPYRQLVLAVASEDPDPALVEQLLGLDRRRWRAVEPIVISMVRKLRGDSRAALVDLLERRGTVRDLTRRLTRFGAVGRARAAELLGLLGSHAPREALERLLLADGDPDVRIVAARALGEIGDPASAGVLLESVTGDHPVPMRIVARSLARLGPGATATLAASLTAREADRRAVAAEILGLGGAVTAVGVLAAHATHDPDDDVRIRSARALGRIGVPSGLTALDACCRPDEPAPLRAVAARAIGEIGGNEAVRLLEPLLDDPDHRVAANAARAMGGLGASALDRLRAVAAGDGPGAGYAAEALAMHEIAEARRAGAARADDVVPATVASPLARPPDPLRRDVTAP